MQGEILGTFINSGKIWSLPYQPVYSKEMAETIGQREKEKTTRSYQSSLSFYPLDWDSNVKVTII